MQSISSLTNASYYPNSLCLLGLVKTEYKPNRMDVAEAK
jgi:hypothetical protein